MLIPLPILLSAKFVMIPVNQDQRWKLLSLVGKPAAQRKFIVLEWEKERLCSDFERANYSLASSEEKERDDPPWSINNHPVPWGMSLW
jgi:hypothetical protein